MTTMFAKAQASNKIFRTPVCLTEIPINLSMNSSTALQFQSCKLMGK